MEEEGEGEEEEEEGEEGEEGEEEEEEEASEEEEEEEGGEEESGDAASESFLESSQDDVESASVSDRNEDTCAKCHEDGELICCETCPRAFHTECVGLSRVPRGDWFCDVCTKKRKRNASSSRRASAESGKVGGKASSRASAKATRGAAGIDGGDDVMGHCQVILRELELHPLSTDFLQPVNKRDAPDYYTVVKKPMDFNTIKEKLNFLIYKSSDAFAADIRLVFSNAVYYNGPKHQVAKDAAKLAKMFEVC